MTIALIVPQTNCRYAKGYLQEHFKQIKAEPLASNEKPMNSRQHKQLYPRPLQKGTYRSKLIVALANLRGFRYAVTNA